MRFAVEVPPGWGINVVVVHRSRDAIGLHVEVCVAEVHQGDPKHDGVACSIGRSKWHDHRAKIHMGQRFAELDFCFSNLLGQGFQSVGGVWSPRIACSVERASMACKAVHHVLLLRIDDILQRAFWVVG
ncbi:MAG: hypothetical protein ACKOAH_14870, partial [Pirellula sp.]